MKPVSGYLLIAPDDHSWRLSNLMKIPNADFLNRAGSENLAARPWRLPLGSANTWHKHIRQEEFYFVLEGTGRMRVSGETLSVPKNGPHPNGMESTSPRLPAAGYLGNPSHTRRTTLKGLHQSHTYRSSHSIS